MLRFSLATLLLLVPVAALGCAAIVYASDLVRDITVTAVVLLLGLAALVALCGRGRRRAAAAGLAFVGWAWLLLTSTDVVDVEQYLLTGRVNRWLFSTLYVGRMYDSMFDAGASFETLCDALWALLLGLLGAVAAAVIHGRGRGDSAPDAGAAPSRVED